MFNNLSRKCLSVCLLVLGIIVLSTCSDSGYHNEKITEPAVAQVTKNEESQSGEYIIVLVKDVSIENAIANLKEYEAHVIKGLNRDRYLIELKIDPGIEQLEKHTKNSMFIKLIQPNFSYTTQ